MRKAIAILVSINLLIGLFSISIYAHSGRTDSSGGHYNRSTGEYHYHHGYPAHDHVDGVCPYTKNNSNAENDTQQTPIWKTVLGIAIVVLLASPLILSFFFFIYYRIIEPVVQYVKKKIKQPK